MQATVATQAPGREAREHGPREGLCADTARVTPKPSNGTRMRPQGHGEVGRVPTHGHTQQEGIHVSPAPCLVSLSDTRESPGACGE